MKVFLYIIIMVSVSCFAGVRLDFRLRRRILNLMFVFWIFSLATRNAR